MPIQILIPAATYLEAVNGLVIKPEEKQILLTRVPADNSAVKVYLSEEEKPLLQELLRLRIAKTTRTRITQFVHQVKISITADGDLKQVLEEKPKEFEACLGAFEGLLGKSFEIKIMDRWYLFKMPKIDLAKWQKRIVGFYIDIKFQMVRTQYRENKMIWKENFKDIYGSKSFFEILGDLQIRPFILSTDSDQNHSRIVSLSISAAEDYGKQMLIRGPVLEVKTDTSNKFYGGDQSWETRKYIYEKEKGVIEPELELQGVRRNVWQKMQRQTEEPDGTLPFVRIFSLRTRNYIYTDVRNTEEYKYQLDIQDRLVLKSAHRQILTQIFSADEETIKDLIPGKTGGICVLAWGNPGVGKTLTAEVYAEIKERPLYALSVSEIGTIPEQIEKNLQKVFTRVERWNAVLLFDEADVFLAQRGEDLKQSAVVGMFLRLMDFYTGTLFLTTNRYKTIDSAVDSRLAFRIHYDDLGDLERKSIWTSLLKEAKIGFDEMTLDKLSKLNLDGRKIRNFVRAIQLNKTRNLTWETIEFLLPYIQLEEIK